MRRILLPVLPLILPLFVHAQDICGFLDYRDRFFVFDHGNTRMLEPLMPRGFSSGGGYLAYVASNGDVKVYRDGEVRTIDQSLAGPPVVSDNYFGYVSVGVLKIYEGDSLHVLCRNTGQSVIQDSIVGWYDNMQRIMQIYYKGVTTQVEDALMENPIARISAADNTIAWISKPTSEFKIFWHGKTYVPATLVSDMRFTAGLDMVTFQDPVDHGLKVFDKGEVHDLEPVMPDSIFMGRGLFAFIDRAGALKVYQGGQLYTAAEFTPDEFFVKDSLVVIRDKGYCNIFHDGHTDQVLSYWPSNWAATWGSFAYLDNAAALNLRHNDVNTVVMQRQPVRAFALKRGLLVVSMTNNNTNIWWRGKLYQP
jgi:hypothetical protein